MRLFIRPDGCVGTTPMVEDEIDIRIYSEKDNNKVNYFITGGIGNILYIKNVPHKTILLEAHLLFRIKSYIFYYDNPKMSSNKNIGTNILKRYDV